MGGWLIKPSRGPPITAMFSDQLILMLTASPFPQSPFAHAADGTSNHRDELCRARVRDADGRVATDVRQADEDRRVRRGEELDARLGQLARTDTADHDVDHVACEMPG